VIFTSASCSMDIWLMSFWAICCARAGHAKASRDAAANNIDLDT